MLERDYSLLGKENQQAKDNGLVDAEWYTCYVPEEEMKKLLVRKDWPAIRDTVIWLGLTIGAAYTFIMLWGSVWCIAPFLIYCVLYTTASNSRWHECSHGTAFKTTWLNNAVYELASFMSFYQSITWRWSHARHHSDTIIRGRDPEIVMTRPPNFAETLSKGGLAELSKIFRHAFTNSMDPETADFVPASDYGKVFLRAKVYVFIYVSVITLSVYLMSPIPVMLLFLPPILGSGLLLLYAVTQHVGLNENVLDHRLNSRTVYMNFVHRFLYWNMNYHVEHHMFPMVPYHALPRLHELIKDECPPPNPSLWFTVKEIWQALQKQKIDPEYVIERILPAAKHKNNDKKIFTATKTDELNGGWFKVCKADAIITEGVARFDLDNKTFAVYRSAKNNLYGSDGMCTHGNAHLSTGLIVGEQIECSKHNGRFYLKDGKPARMPVCIDIITYPVKEEDGAIYIDLSKLKTQKDKSVTYTVVNNKNVATYIKELELRPSNFAALDYKPGDYVQLKIPTGTWEIRTENIAEKYHPVYNEHHVFDKTITSTTESTRNYSMATNPAIDKTIKFNVRLALPQEGSGHPIGIGSSYVTQLTAGDTVTLNAPFGDFHIKDTEAEMVYIGGGAGMAPLRSHISYLLETMQSKRKISFWYGARNKDELFYKEYFESLAKAHPNFTFNVAFSEISHNETDLQGHIHDVVDQQFMANQNNVQAIEYYLCGPPIMIKATKLMLWKYEVPDEQIAFDEF